MGVTGWSVFLIAAKEEVPYLGIVARDAALIIRSSNAEYRLLSKGGVGVREGVVWFDGGGVTGTCRSPGTELKGCRAGVGAKREGLGCKSLSGDVLYDDDGRLLFDRGVPGRISLTGVTLRAGDGGRTCARAVLVDIKGVSSARL